MTQYKCTCCTRKRGQKIGVLQVLCGSQSKVWNSRRIVPCLVYQPTAGQKQYVLNLQNNE